MSDPITSPESAQTFRALRVEKPAQNEYTRHIQTLALSTLPDQPVRIRVHYSALNYKDALSAHGHRGITRHYPHTPGIDAAGVVSHSQSPDWHVGQKVIVTSYDLGMNTAGGLAEYIQVPAEWCVPLPEGLSLKESMVLGTAGFTAALALEKLQRVGLKPESGPVVVTGASGGVGSLAVALLAKLGYEVWAVTGRQEAHEWLQTLGANQILERSEVDDRSGKALLRSRWAGAIDTAGGTILSTLLRSCHKEGAVAACGLVQAPEFPATVYPFILNGVHLLGVDSAEYPLTPRQQLWQKLASTWKLPDLESLSTELPLDAVPRALENMLQGSSPLGRQVVCLP